jgi:hypothetical protein
MLERGFDTLNHGMPDYSVIGFFTICGKYGAPDHFGPILAGKAINLKKPNLRRDLQIRGW